MAERRTKEDKDQATQRRLAQLEESYSLPELEGDFKIEAGFSDSEQTTDLLAYSTQLIKKDLMRTTIATALVFVVLVALYFSF